jgi:NTE family protein
MEYNIPMAAKFIPKIGLALGSGGAKGFAHIGIIKTLERHGIPIDLIAGSSIGSFIGAHYAAYKDSKRLEELILGLNRTKGLQLFDPTLRGGIMKGRKTERFIEEVLDGATFDSLKIPYAAVATDLNTAEAVVFTDGSLVKAIRVSISVPAFFQPVFHKKRLLGDGGLSNPIPVDIARAMGADIIIAVNLDTVYLEKTLEDIPPLASVPLHSINILRHNLALHSVKNADIVISPRDILQVGLLGWNTLFSTEKAKQIIKAGEEAAEEQMPLIKEIIRKSMERKTRISRVLNFVHRFRRLY